MDARTWVAVGLGVLALVGWFLALLLNQGCETREKRIVKLEGMVGSLDAERLNWMQHALKLSRTLASVEERRVEEVSGDAGAGA
jgi:hypothetical protein